VLNSLRHPVLLSTRVKAVIFSTALSLFAVAGFPSASQAEPLSREPTRTDDLTSQVAVLDARIDAAVSRYAQATAALSAVRSEIGENRRRQRVARYELEVARAHLGERAVALYKNVETTTLDVLFDAADLNELVRQFTLVQRLEQGDREVVRSIARTRRDLDVDAARLQADMVKAERLLERRKQEFLVIRQQLGQRRALLAQARAAVRRSASEPASNKASAARPLEPKAEQSTPAGGWWPLVQKAATQNGVDPRGMHRLLMVESGGSATVVGPGGFVGLFQYAPSTWKGSWNPYRTANITDGAAQIRATALALRLGYGPSWWKASYAWAFGES
jgi:peptidoglycan hydrolase CwlO-like protein